MPLGLLKRFFKRQETKEPIVIVSGLPRSGTSLMMQMLAAGGLPPLTDNERSADDDNPKGYLEFERVKQLKEGDTKWVENAQGKAVKVISALLEYLPRRKRYKVIFMRRELEEVLASQQQMLVRRGEAPGETGDQAMAQMYKRHLSTLEAWLAAQDHIETLYVRYDQLLADPEARSSASCAFWVCRWMLPPCRLCPTKSSTGRESNNQAPGSIGFIARLVNPVFLPALSSQLAERVCCRPMTSRWLLLYAHLSLLHRSSAVL